MKNFLNSETFSKKHKKVWKCWIFLWKTVAFLTELLQMYLQCCTAQKTGQRMGKSSSTYSVPQNTGKTWTFFIFYSYSPTGYIYRLYKAAPLHQMLLFSKVNSLFCPCLSSLRHQELRMSSSSVRSCNCTTFPGKMHMSFRILFTKLSPVLQLWNIIRKRVASTYYLTWNTWGDFAWCTQLSEQERCCAAYQ